MQTAYLISYDIADKRRLHRLHRHVQRETFQLLESLYLLIAPPAQVDRLWHSLRSICHPGKDQLQFLPLDQRFPLVLGGTAIPAADVLLLGWPLWCSVENFLAQQASP